MTNIRSAPPTDPYVYPHDLFEALPAPHESSWTCVRSRPRWEKKLSESLRARQVAHYLPVAIHHTYSGRKRRTASLPLFPGFVFVKGDHTKMAFRESGCVAYVLRPEGAMQARALDEQIRAVRRLLLEDGKAELSPRYLAGERVIIGSGPLRGLTGTFVANANARRFVVWVDMLGVGVSVVLEGDTRLEKAAGAPCAPMLQSA